MNAPNLPLLRKVLEHIDAHPEEWDQHSWAAETDCGTTCCIAGWAVKFTGHEFQWGTGITEGLSHYTSSGKPIREVARRELGLTHIEADDLFYVFNNRDDIQLIAEEIAERAGEKL